MSVDVIAQAFLKTLKEDNPHRELIAEAVIGTAVEGHSAVIGTIVGALSGWIEEINIEVDKVYGINPKHLNFYGMDENPTNELYPVLVTEVNKYKPEDKVRVDYSYTDRSGRERKEHTWVSHLELKELKPPAKVDDNHSAQESTQEGPQEAH